MFADFVQKLAPSQTEIIPSLLCISTLLPCLFLIHQGPSLRQRHTLTKGCHHSNKRERAKKDTLWGGRRREYSETERDREGVNNLKTEKKNLIERADRWRGRERASDGGERQRVFLSGPSHTAKILTSSDFDNRRCQPLTLSLSIYLCFSHHLYSYLLAALILSATIWVCLSDWDRALLLHKLWLLNGRLIESRPHPASADPTTKCINRHRPTWHSHPF